MLSIIIPILNEEKILIANSHKFGVLNQKAELIFVDGGSTDKSIEIAGEYGEMLQSKKGRAVQMNQGAKYALHDIFLFLHADSSIFLETLLSIEKEIQNNGFVGGCLTQRIEKNGFIYRIIEAQGNVRAKISKVFYGDQGIFVKKKTFFQIGGFPEVPIMEDVLFTKKLKNIGKTIVMPDIISVSSRRWDNGGIAKTILRYNLINVAFKLGVPLGKIKLLYEDIR